MPDSQPTSPAPTDDSAASPALGVGEAAPKEGAHSAPTGAHSASSVAAKSNNSSTHATSSGGAHSAGSHSAGKKKGGAGKAVLAIVIVIALIAGGAWLMRDKILEYAGPYLKQVPFLQQLLGESQEEAVPGDEEAEPIPVVFVGDTADAVTERVAAVHTATQAPIGTPRAATEWEAYAAVDDITPVFAYCGSVPLHVAVPILDLTEILFHQASYDWAIPLTTPLTDADPGWAQNSMGTGRDNAAQGGGNTELTGFCLRLYRKGRKTTPDTAVDCGAPAGDPVLSPVNGTVTLVEQYTLYKKLTDYQIHIQPYGHPELDVVLIHIESPTVVAGDQVVGGYTQIGSVRNLVPDVGLQLGYYTPEDDPGNHTHICVNDATVEGYFGLVGAATVDENGTVTSPATITADTPIEQVYEMRRAAAAALGLEDITIPNPDDDKENESPQA